MARAPFELAGTRIPPGSRAQIDVPVAKLYTHAPLHIPVEVVHGRQPARSCWFVGRFTVMRSMASRSCVACLD